MHSPATNLVYQEHRLLGTLEVSFDTDRESVVPDERAVSDKVGQGHIGMPVAVHIMVCPPRLVPLGDSFVDGDCKTPDTALVADAMPMMEAKHLVINGQVDMIPVPDDKPCPVALHPLAQGVVHEVLQRVALLGRDVGLLRDTSMVSAGADDSQLQLRVVEQELDAGLDEFLCVHRRFDWP